ncbi:hypothetical protein ACLOJK_035413 [Asimina triloba]
MTLLSVLQLTGGRPPSATTKCAHGDLGNKILPKAIKGELAYNTFEPMRIRIGGSLQDQVLYAMSKSVTECPPDFKKDPKGLFGFSSGCLSRERWDEVNELFTNSGAVLTFGLNALYGRALPKSGTGYSGAWNPSNTRDFIEYTIAKGYNVDSYEFGNELSGGGVSAKVAANQYSSDVKVLKNLLLELYKNSTTQPKLWAPGGFFETKWYQDFLEATGPHVVDVLTHHIYNLGPGGDPKLMHRLQDPFTLDNTIQTLNDILVTIQRFGPWADAAISESGGAYNSGGPADCRVIELLDWYRYLDSLGATSTFNHKTFCRQTLIGGNYGLLNTTTMEPNPDYYSALLFHRLMGKGVLSTHHNGSPYLRSYVHCSKNTTGITVLLINLSNSTSFHISLVNDLNFYPPRQLQELSSSKGFREEYNLTPENGDLKSQTMLLNGEPLLVDCRGNIPDLEPEFVDASTHINISPSSIKFVVLKNFRAPACS